MSGWGMVDDRDFVEIGPVKVYYWFKPGDEVLSVRLTTRDKGRGDEIVVGNYRVASEADIPGVIAALAEMKREHDLENPTYAGDWKPSKHRIRETDFPGIGDVGLVVDHNDLTMVVPVWHIMASSKDRVSDRNGNFLLSVAEESLTTRPRASAFLEDFKRTAEAAGIRGVHAHTRSTYHKHGHRQLYGGGTDDTTTALLCYSAPGMAHDPQAAERLAKRWVERQAKVKVLTWGDTTNQYSAKEYTAEESLTGDDRFNLGTRADAVMTSPLPLFARYAKGRKYPNLVGPMSVVFDDVGGERLYVVSGEVKGETKPVSRALLVGSLLAPSYRDELEKKAKRFDGGTEKFTAWARELMATEMQPACVAGAFYALRDNGRFDGVIALLVGESMNGGAREHVHVAAEEFAWMVGACDGVQSVRCEPPAGAKDTALLAFWRDGRIAAIGITPVARREWSPKAAEVIASATCLLSDAVSPRGLAEIKAAAAKVEGAGMKIASRAKPFTGGTESVFPKLAMLRSDLREVIAACANVTKGGVAYTSPALNIIAGDESAIVAITDRNGLLRFGARIVVAAKVEAQGTTMVPVGPTVAFAEDVATATTIMLQADDVAARLTSGASASVPARGGRLSYGELLPSLAEGLLDVGELDPAAWLTSLRALAPAVSQDTTRPHIAQLVISGGMSFDRESALPSGALGLASNGHYLVASSLGGLSGLPYGAQFGVGLQELPLLELFLEKAKQAGVRVTARVGLPVTPADFVKKKIASEAMKIGTVYGLVLFEAGNGSSFWRAYGDPVFFPTVANMTDGGRPIGAKVSADDLAAAAADIVEREKSGRVPAVALAFDGAGGVSLTGHWRSADDEMLEKPVKVKASVVGTAEGKKRAVEVKVSAFYLRDAMASFKGETVTLMLTNLPADGSVSSVDPIVVRSARALSVLMPMRL